MKIKMLIVLLLFFFINTTLPENKPFNPLDEDVTIDVSTNSNLSSFEDSIIQKLILLGTSYNKQATFLAVAFGVVIAIFFPQETKSFISSFAFRTRLCMEKIRQKIPFLSKKDVIATAKELQ